MNLVLPSSSQQDLELLKPLPSTANLLILRHQILLRGLLVGVCVPVPSLAPLPSSLSKCLLTSAEELPETRAWSQNLLLPQHFHRSKLFVFLKLRF